MKEIDDEIKNVEEILKIFKIASVTDIQTDKRYRALESYIELLKKYKELQIKYENIKRELIARANRYFEKE